MTPQTDTGEVLIRREGAAGILSLNRPQAIHSLTLEMVHAMTAALLEWRDDPAVEAVILDHATGRGFCAGGDIADLRESIVNAGGVTESAASTPPGSCPCAIRALAPASASCGR